MAWEASDFRERMAALRAAHGAVVVLTGAGISRESGLHTFRDADGIWASVSIDEVATPQAFARDPARVHAFYNQRRRGLLDPVVLPNPAHAALARLERDWPGAVLVVTQNIDDLHERAGSRTLVHMHGELLKARCGGCGTVIRCREDLAPAHPCVACGNAGGVRPHVVWFGEMPLELDRIYHALGQASLFAAIGTSGTVYPAAGFVDAVPRGCVTVEINLEPSEGASRFVHRIHGPAGTAVPAFVDALCGGDG
ncbi:MAG: NAD-dependent deacylase [Alphaproteobacteria bacterium]